MDQRAPRTAICPYCGSPVGPDRREHVLGGGVVRVNLFGHEHYYRPRGASLTSGDVPDCTPFPA